MIRILGIILICSLYISCSQQKTELVLLGTVHQPVKHFNADSLYTILNSIQPHLILFEVDSSFFTADFRFKKSWYSNENVATTRYIDSHDIDVRPYDFSGRNDYRRRIGSRPTDGLALQLLDSLYQANRLDTSAQNVYARFLRLSASLDSCAMTGAAGFNNPGTDSIAQQRQQSQYDDVLRIIQDEPLFSSTFFVKPAGDSISYAEGYKRASAFWHLRNRTMAQHILQYVDLYKGKRIVVLNGFFHRYYLRSLLLPEQGKHSFVIKDFDEY